LLPAISLLDPDAAPKLDAALREFGFFELVDHGLPSTLIDAAFDASRRFFALPEPTKALWHIERSPFKHGFDPIGWQALDPDRPFDLKESFYVGAGRDADDPVVRAGALNQGPNQWPDETEYTALAGFRVACERYADHAQALVQRLLRLCAQALALAPGHFEASTRAPTCTLRLLHYPPQAASGSGLPGQLGCGAHTDWGALTLLAQDDAGGLQVQTRGGEWFDLLPRPQALVVNAGDMMPRWTNDRWRSAPHRVVNRRAGARRYSIAYFFDLDHEAWIAPLPGCVSAQNPARYAPVQAGAHLLEMYRRTTLKA
jgi:isopenicillin N synthase-like dioxygenase